MINARVVTNITDGVIKEWLLIKRKMKLEAIHDIGDIGVGDVVMATVSVDDSDGDSSRGMTG